MATNGSWLALASLSVSPSWPVRASWSSSWTQLAQSHQPGHGWPPPEWLLDDFQLAWAGLSNQPINEQARQTSPQAIKISRKRELKSSQEHQQQHVTNSKKQHHHYQKPKGHSIHPKSQQDAIQKQLWLGPDMDPLGPQSRLLQGHGPIQMYHSDSDTYGTNLGRSHLKASPSSGMIGPSSSSSYLSQSSPTATTTTTTTTSTTTGSSSQTLSSSHRLTGHKNKKPVHVNIKPQTVNGLLFLLLLFILAVSGSIGCIFIVSALTVIESLQTRGNCFLVSLALAQLLVTLLVVPSSALQIVAADSLNGRLVCHYQWLTLEFSLIVSQLSFLLIAADNYLGYNASQKLIIGGHQAPAYGVADAGQLSSNEPAPELEHQPERELKGKTGQQGPEVRGSSRLFGLDVDAKQADKRPIRKPLPSGSQQENPFEPGEANWRANLTQLSGVSETRSKVKSLSAPCWPRRLGPPNDPSSKRVQVRSGAGMEAPTVWSQEGHLCRRSLFDHRNFCGRFKVLTWIVLTWLLAALYSHHQREISYGPDFCTTSSMLSSTMQPKAMATSTESHSQLAAQPHPSRRSLQPRPSGLEPELGGSRELDRQSRGVGEVRASAAYLRVEPLEELPSNPVRPTALDAPSILVEPGEPGAPGELGRSSSSHVLALYGRQTGETRSKLARPEVQGAPVAITSGLEEPTERSSLRLGLVDRHGQRGTSGSGHGERGQAISGKLSNGHNNELSQRDPDGRADGSDSGLVGQLGATNEATTGCRGCSCHRNMSKCTRLIGRSVSGPLPQVKVDRLPEGGEPAPRVLGSVEIERERETETDRGSNGAIGQAAFGLPQGPDLNNSNSNSNKSQNHNHNLNHYRSHNHNHRRHHHHHHHHFTHNNSNSKLRNYANAYHDFDCLPQSRTDDANVARSRRPPRAHRQTGGLMNKDDQSVPTLPEQPEAVGQVSRAMSGNADADWSWPTTQPNNNGSFPPTKANPNAQARLQLKRPPLYWHMLWGTVIGPSLASLFLFARAYLKMKDFKTRSYQAAPMLTMANLAITAFPAATKPMSSDLTSPACAGQHQVTAGTSSGDKEAEQHAEPLIPSSMHQHKDHDHPQHRSQEEKLQSDKLDDTNCSIELQHEQLQQSMHSAGLGSPDPNLLAIWHRHPPSPATLRSISQPVGTSDRSGALAAFQVPASGFKPPPSSTDFPSTQALLITSGRGYSSSPFPFASRSCGSSADPQAQRQPLNQVLSEPVTGSQLHHHQQHQPIPLPRSMLQAPLGAPEQTLGSPHLTASRDPSRAVSPMSNTSFSAPPSATFAPEISYWRLAQEELTHELASDLDYKSPLSRNQPHARSFQGTTLGSNRLKHTQQSIKRILPKTPQPFQVLSNQQQQQHHQVDFREQQAPMATPLGDIDESPQSSLNLGSRTLERQHSLPPSSRLNQNRTSRSPRYLQHGGGTLLESSQPHVETNIQLHEQTIHQQQPPSEQPEVSAALANVIKSMYEVVPGVGEEAEPQQLVQNWQTQDAKSSGRLSRKRHGTCRNPTIRLDSAARRLSDSSVNRKSKLESLTPEEHTLVDKDDCDRKHFADSSSQPPGHISTSGPLSSSAQSAAGVHETGGLDGPRYVIYTYAYMIDDRLLRSNIIVFLLSFTLWLPFIVMSVLSQYHVHLTQELKDSVWWISTLNCCSCSYVYALSNRDFRDAFNKLFYYCCCKSHVTFQKRTPIFRRQLDTDSKGNIRIHIVPGVNVLSTKWLQQGGDPSQHHGHHHANNQQHHHHHNIQPHHQYGPGFDNKHKSIESNRASFAHLDGITQITHHNLHPYQSRASYSGPREPVTEPGRACQLSRHVHLAVDSNHLKEQQSRRLSDEDPFMSFKTRSQNKDYPRASFNPTSNI